MGLIVDVISLGDAPPHALGLRGVTVHAISTPAGSGPAYFWNVHRAVKREASLRPAAVYHASDLYVLPALTGAARRCRARIVYDARELYPYVASTVGRPWVRACWWLVERSHIRKADLVFTVSSGIADKLSDLYGIRRPTLLYNVPEITPIPERRSLRAASDVTFSSVMILHQGQMRRDRGCELLVDAMRDVEGAILVFLGDGPLRPHLEAQAAEAQLSSRVVFVDPVPPDQLLSFTASADIGVTLLQDTCLNHRYALPNKLFEYLAAHVPVIGSDLPEIRNVISTYEVGQVVEPGNRADLVAALNQAVIDKTLRERWRRNIPHMLETFNWTQASEQFLRVYKELLGETP